MISENKQVILISLTNRMGGAEQMLLMIANTLDSPLIFLKRVRNYSLPLKVGQKVNYVTTKPLIFGFFLLVKALYKYRKGYIIISSHAYMNAFLGLLKRIGYIKSKLVVRESTSLFSRYNGIKRLSYKLAYRLGYPVVGLIICQTESMRNELLKNNTYLRDKKVITLNNAIDLKLVQMKGEESLNDPLTEIEFVCTAGRLIKIKGFDILIRSFKKISLIHDNLNLLILGEGPEREALTNLISELNLNHRVFLMGHIDNPYPYFKKAKLCVVSSIKEGFPNVLLQMMALNSKVVSTLCADGINDIPAIITVKTQDIQDLKDGIENVLHEDSSKKREELDAFLGRRTPESFITTLLSNVS